MSLTAAQSRAVAAEGNVLVVAGAGTGKTRTLVERCLKVLLEEQPPADLEQVLMVTFTDAAAAEMRQRIRMRLEERANATPPDRMAREHLALFETAQIGTLHSFCLQLVRQHFYELEIDPQVAVLAQEEARLLEQETLDALLEAHYNGDSERSRAIQQLMEVHGRGSDQAIRALILKLHHYTQTRPDPERWFELQRLLLEDSEPSRWRHWLEEAVAAWRQKWLPHLQGLAAGNPVAAHCAERVRDLPLGEPEGTAAGLQAAAQGAEVCPPRKKTVFVKPLAEFFLDAAFLNSVYPRAGKANPLAEDWDWVRGHMLTLLDLAAEFSRQFSRSKRELGLLDFHDLEQYSLRLLWDPRSDRPTPVAEFWRQRLRHVFVDEYQDINAAQDKIIECLSRDGPQGNRFLVGDVKQSIYRFRLADPYIFQSYAATWRSGPGSVIPLVENFRSRAGILNFVNSVFQVLMQPAVGRVAYDDEARLAFGSPETRGPLSQGDTERPPVELHLLKRERRATAETEEEPGAAGAGLGDSEAADKEARLVGLRLRELRASAHPVWDEARRDFRPVNWGDMAVLLRSPYKKAESYAKEFARLGIPLTVERGGFYESLEVSDLLNLLRLLDNPLQDLPLLAVLRSPLVGLLVSELAEVRLAMKGRYWLALNHWHRAVAGRLSDAASTPAVAEGPGPGLGSMGTFAKVDLFLKRYQRWRRLARQESLSRCLEAVLAETHYAEWVVTQTRGEQRRGNVQRLLHLAHQFDRFQRQSLFRFLRFVEAQQLTESEPEPAGAGGGDAVRLMSIHQSKGLEFPVVAAADLGKPFNRTDLRADIILDEVYGLCPLIKPPEVGRRYPSLPYWLARQRQNRELLGEEMRLLYVAMTRARDLLLLTGTVAATEWGTRWVGGPPADGAALLAAGRYLDWLALWFGGQAAGSEPGAAAGQTDLVRWRIWEEADRLAALPGPEAPPALDVWSAEDGDALRAVKERLDWEYPWAAATAKPAKTSVTTLRRLAALEDQTDVAAPLGRVLGSRVRSAGVASGKGRVRMTGAEVGHAYHRFLQHCELGVEPQSAALQREAHRLREGGVLSEAECEAIDVAAIARFWSSEPGARIRLVPDCVRRELPFTARFTPAEIALLCGLPTEPGLEAERVLIQGVVDLAVVWPDRIWIVDFKTDDASAATLPEKVGSYTPQLRLYAAALQRIYGRPVERAWLYFLRLGESIPVDVIGLPE